MWFFKLIRQFFFSLDSVVYNFISTIYDLLITISRTSVLTQADIAQFSDRVYKMLIVTMVFKVTLSLITYVVNPDDFSDKNKGISKLGTNIVISLAMLVLTPYVFRYAYQFQTIVIESNTLGTLILGEETGDNIINSAGDYIAFSAMSPFFAPNYAYTELSDCFNVKDGETFNNECYKQLRDVDKEDGSEGIIDNYKAGVEHNSLGLMFRSDAATLTATLDGEEEFVIDYKIVFSTVVGVIIILLLLTYCMDVAVRSIKLAFLQIVAPIPILSYVDPKSGKDGMFKKWYQMCFKTYLSLFVRLLALYFAIYVIGVVNKGHLVDIIDGSYQTNMFVQLFIIIGALMFAKQFPKILEGLGVKLDGDGKFNLNPLKKFEEGAMFGKNITGATRGAMVGAAGMVSGAGIGRGISGAWRGMTSGKGWKETGKAEAEMNKKMRQAKLDGSNFTGRLGARVAGAMGLPSQSESIEGRIHKIDEEVKKLDNAMAPSKKSAQEKKLYADSVAAMEKRAVDKIESGEAGVLSVEYRKKQARIESLKSQLDQAARAGMDTSSLEEQIAMAENESRRYLNDEAMKRYIDANLSGDAAERTAVFGKADGSDATLDSLTKKMESIVSEYGASHANMRKGDAKTLHSSMGSTKGEITDIEVANENMERKKRNLEESKKEIYEEQRKAKADESAIK